MLNHRPVWLVLAVFIVAGELCAQHTYRVTFVDKGPEGFTPGSALYETTLSEYHPDALQRRERHGVTPVLQYPDAPVYQAYLDSLAGLNASAFVRLRWTNSVLVNVDSATAEAIAKLPFVETIVRTSEVQYSTAIEPDNCSPVSYGESAPNHTLLNTQPLHDAGVFGKGARVAVIDNGFNYAQMSCLQHVNVDAAYDVIYDDSDVANDANDPPGQDGHGSLVLSLLAGWCHDTLIGTAPFANYLLVKTEDMRHERRIEEEYYVAGLEWAERNGASISSSSVGYYAFDSTEQQHDYEVMDGRTTFADVAVNRAVSLGMVCIAASGNNGAVDSTLLIPAAADSVIAVGACLRSGLYWPASSKGPTADGRTKPDVATLGTSVYCQTPAGGFLRANGTSLSAPQVAGGVALLEQLYPRATTWQLRNALYASCRYLAEESDVLGRGIPDITVAARFLGSELGAAISPPVVANVGTTRTVFTCVFADDVESVELRVGTTQQIISATKIDSLWHEFRLHDVTFESDSLPVEIIVRTSNHITRFPFEVPRQATVLPCGIRLPSSVVSVRETNSPLPETSHDRRVPFQIWPNVAERGTSFTLVRVNGTSEVTDVCLVHTTTGEIVETQRTNSDGATIVHHPSLAAGRYLVVITTRDGILSLPLIIE